MVAKSFVGVAFLLVFLSTISFAQPRAPTGRVSLATWILGRSTDSVTVCIAYEVLFKNVIFTKSDDTPSLFTAALSFSVDALDSIQGVNHHRDSRKKLAAQSFDDTRSNTRHAADFVALDLPRSVYKINVELRDDEQKINYLNTVIRRRFHEHDSSAIFSVIFLDSLSGERYDPVMSNHVAPFPNRIRFLVLTNSGDPLSASLSKRSLNASQPVFEVPVTFYGRQIMPLEAGQGFFFSGSESSSRALYFGALPVDTLAEGSYRLALSQGGHTDFYDFEYLWRDKPLTLRNITMALSLLRYIISDSLYSEINSGSDKEIEEKFAAFWKAHDPTPSTAFNELEAEYYERADYAFEQFRSVGSLNGAATDRGKAYILFGKPESVKRDYRSDGTYEIWNYPKLKRSLVFRELGAGDFRLYQTEKL